MVGKSRSYPGPIRGNAKAPKGLLGHPDVREGFFDLAGQSKIIDSSNAFVIVAESSAASQDDQTMLAVARVFLTKNRNRLAPISIISYIRYT